MIRQDRKATEAQEWNFSSTALLRRFGVLAVLVVVAITVGTVFQTTATMERNVTRFAQQLDSKIEFRINESLALLNSIAVQDRYADSSVPVDQKIRELELISDQFGYMMIRYVDADMNVWSARGATSLASRDYLQAAFATGEPQVTDSFLAGADGQTLNYTVAVPIVRDGHTVGAIFCAIYFDEMVNMLQEDSVQLAANAALIGSQNQIMSSSSGNEYGASCLDIERESMLFGATVEDVESHLNNNEPISFWGIRAGQLLYTSYVPVENTNWNLICAVSFLPTLISQLPAYLFTVVLVLLAFALVMWRTHKMVAGQIAAVDNVVESIQGLKRSLYQDGQPPESGIDEIIRLTSTGLADSLTGIATRSVFMNQFEDFLNEAPEDKIVALCFIDVDDLRLVNDTYDHTTGDIGLRSVGYIVREYERKYSGLAGRYGGDEFILVLRDIDTEAELREALGGLALRLNISVPCVDGNVSVTCSIGVSVWDRASDPATFIKEAEEALYYVKLNGKHAYHLYQDRAS